MIKPTFGTALVALFLAACSSSSTTTTSSASPTNEDAGDAGASTSTSPEDKDSGTSSGEVSCTAARATVLSPIAKASTGEVKVISSTGGVTTIYVDASAGGMASAASNPRVYLKLTGEKVAIDDNAAFTSTAWDLALKRVDIYTNSGDAGLGLGGALLVSKSFDAVSAADLTGTTLRAESFFDADCNGIKDEAGYIVTTFGGWYDYSVGVGLAVAPSTTFLVRGADGKSVYKVGILSYTATSDGGVDGKVNGRFLLKVAAL